MNPDLKSRLEKILSEPIKSTSSVSGGCIADSRKLQLDSGKVYFLKQLRGSSSGALMLRRVDLKSFVNQAQSMFPRLCAKVRISCCCNGLKQDTADRVPAWKCWGDSLRNYIDTGEKSLDILKTIFLVILRSQISLLRKGA